MLLPVSFMFEKVTKWFINKSADGAIEEAKSTFNEKVDQYGDIIKVGLVLSVIILGGRHITKRNSHSGNYLPDNTCSGQSPIVINNFYSDNYGRNERREKTYGKQQRNFIQEQPRKMDRKH